MTRLTTAQANRIVDLLAMGPLDAQPVDAELRAMGWAQFYDEVYVDQRDSGDLAFYLSEAEAVAAYSYLSAYPPK